MSVGHGAQGAHGGGLGRGTPGGPPVTGQEVAEAVGKEQDAGGEERPKEIPEAVSKAW